LYLKPHNCDVGHNDGGICKITSPALFYLLTTAHLGNDYIHQITSKEQRWPDVAFFDRSKEHRLTAD